MYVCGRCIGGDVGTLKLQEAVLTPSDNTVEVI